MTSFLISFGIADDHDQVRTLARTALQEVVAKYGSSAEAIAFLLPQLNTVLQRGSASKESSTSTSLDLTKAPSTATSQDRRKEAAVVALGSVALHLSDASQIDQTVDMLLSSLKTTTSADVQSSIADGLVKLMKKGNTQERIESILEQLLTDALQSESSSVRNGAALGLAAAVKGSGIGTLKKFGIVQKLQDGCSSTESSTVFSKEGSLLTMQCLCKRLKLLFEPYVIVLLPSLLQCFSDGSDRVRVAADQAASTIMSQLSAHGVKLVLPAVVSSLEDSSNSNWRTKQASIAMLGSMCHLAPKQLASALPQVVPQLTQAYSDTHPKVKSAAEQALTELSTVISNPEIKSICPILLQALTDPAESTLVALEELIQTEFVHSLDAPSLALVVPILHRGLKDRAATTKRYSALIAGNMVTMIHDARDFVPYLSLLLPDLKASLLDPIPDVRSICSKALGSLVRGLGQDRLPELSPWLLETLQSETVSSAERSGAAQGLTEVLLASGQDVLEQRMADDILPLSSHPSGSTREGVLWVLCYLPPALGVGFATLLDASLPALIHGLADDAEQVRDVSMRAGRVLIQSQGRTHVDKILPILQTGMQHPDDPRIRYSSLLLLGDLLSMLGGTVVLRTDGDTQDDMRKAEQALAQLTLCLGLTTRNQVLAELYLLRSDTAHSVRTGAIQVWKTVVPVTARTLRQILPVLVQRVVSDLANSSSESSSSDGTERAAKCLGDIVQKLGDMVLPEIIPILKETLERPTSDATTRRGVCVGLSELIASSTKDQVLNYLEILVKAVQAALCDDDEGVRQMAATSFQNLHQLVGSRAMDEVVPSLMVSLESSQEEQQTRALNGLTGILSIRSRELLPYLIPRLMATPITLHHAKALSGIAKVTGSTIYHHFSTILPALLKDLSSSNKEEEEDAERIEAVRACCQSLFGHVDESGVNILISEIATKCSSSDKAAVRAECCWMLQVVITERKCNDACWFACCEEMCYGIWYLDDDETHFSIRTKAELLAEGVLQS